MQIVLHCIATLWHVAHFGLLHACDRSVERLAGSVSIHWLAQTDDHDACLQVRASVRKGIVDMANSNLEKEQLISEVKNHIAIVR